MLNICVARSVSPRIVAGVSLDTKIVKRRAEDSEYETEASNPVILKKECITNAETISAE
jgi:hypothetical protein